MLSPLAGLLSGQANRLRNALDFVMRRADDEWVSPLGPKVAKGLGDCLCAIKPCHFTHGSNRLELFETAFRIPPQFLNSLPVVFRGLPHLGQRDTLQSRFLFQHSQGIAGFDALDLFSIFRQRQCESTVARQPEAAPPSGDPRPCRLRRESIPCREGLPAWPGHAAIVRP